MFAIDPVTILLSIVCILFLAHVYNKSQAKYKNFPPGPKPWPVFGNILSIDMKKPHKTFIELSKTYGPVIGIQIGMEKMVVLCGYDTLKDALISHAEQFSDRAVPPIVSKSRIENGLIFSNGENWKVMRRFALSTLRDYGMGKRTIEDKISEEAECLVQTIMSHGGKPFNIHNIINAAVANIMVSILLSHRFEYEDPTMQQLMRLVNENLRLVGTPIVKLYNSFPFLVGLLPGGHKKISENRLQFKNFVRATFTKQRKELDVNDQRNLVDAFLVKQQEKVQDEIQKVIGTAQPRLEHRKQMPYTDAVIHEILRYGDITPGSVVRATSQDVTFRGYFIPKGTAVIPVLYTSLRDELYFEKPNEFYPEHFLDSKGNLKKNDAFIPFSMGKRSCAGETLAKMELFLFFTKLLQHFNFQAPPGALLDLTPDPGFTNAPLPYELCAISRT